MIVFMLIGTVNVYLFKDYFGSAKALTMVGLLQSCAVFVAMPFINPLVKKFGKKEVASAGLLVAAVVYAVLILLTRINSNAIYWYFNSGYDWLWCLQLVIWAFVTDVIDYHEYLTGLREDGTVYSIYSMARKIGQAVAGGVGGIAIAAVGYNADAAGQTAETLQGIHTLGTLVPAIVLGSCFL